MSGPKTAAVLRYFEYQHLPAHLQAISRPVGELALTMVEQLQADHPQLLAGLQDLLRAKDCLVRAALDSPSHAPLTGIEIRK